MPDPSSSAAASGRMAGPPLGGTGTGLADGLPEPAKKTSRPQPGAISGSHPEADTLPLAEAEEPTLCAEATEVNMSAPIMDRATNRSSFFTISPSVASPSDSHVRHKALPRSRSARPYSAECVEESL